MSLADTGMDGLFRELDSFLKNKTETTPSQTIRKATAGEQVLMDYDSKLGTFNAATLSKETIGSPNRNIQKLRASLLESGYTIIYTETAFVKCSLDFALEVGPLLALLGMMKGI